jgi:hypothetical protein
MDSNKQQTALELFFKELPEIIQEGYLYKFEEAKEMEKQQIIEAQDEALKTYFYVKYKNPKDYYEQTFNQ